MCRLCDLGRESNEIQEGSLNYGTVRQTEALYSPLDSQETLYSSN